MSEVYKIAQRQGKEIVSAVENRSIFCVTYKVGKKVPLSLCFSSEEKAERWCANIMRSYRDVFEEDYNPVMLVGECSLSIPVATCLNSLGLERLYKTVEAYQEHTKESVMRWRRGRLSEAGFRFIYKRSIYAADAPEGTVLAFDFAPKEVREVVIHTSRRKR